MPTRVGKQARGGPALKQEARRTKKSIAGLASCLLMLLGQEAEAVMCQTAQRPAEDATKPTPSGAQSFVSFLANPMCELLICLRKG